MCSKCGYGTKSEPHEGYRICGRDTCKGFKGQCDQCQRWTKSDRDEEGKRLCGRESCIKQYNMCSKCGLPTKSRKKYGFVVCGRTGCVGYKGLCSVCGFWSSSVDSTSDGAFKCANCDELMEIVFDNDKAVPQNPRLDTRKSMIIDNGSSEQPPSSMTFKIGVSTTQSTTHDVNWKFAIRGGIKSTSKVSTGAVPGGEQGFELFAETTFEIGHKFTFTDSRTQSREETLTVPVQADAGKKVKCSATQTTATVTIPYTMIFKSGKTATGQWKGTVYGQYKIKYETLE